ncbi:MAG: DUF3750 domain-containing protein [Planctomycetota bacterium]|nr:DUF3750 domain-containing protein [Planctomycetota bacterium]
MQRSLAFSSVLVLASVVSCQAARPSQIPVDEDWIVAVKSCRLGTSPSWYKRFAHHSWIDFKRGSEGAWERVESLGPLGIGQTQLSAEEARLDRRLEGESVRLLGILTGEEARKAIPGIDQRSKELAKKYEDYVAWPGPNSNTFVAEVAQGVPELAFVFDPNAVGKDYGGWIDAGLTASKTGVRVDTLPLGFALGLKEGVELHLLQLTLGVSFDPPGISLPFVPQIPWGWLEPEEQRLPPPDVDAVRTIAIGAATPLDPVELGELPLEGTIVIARDDGRGWLELRYVGEAPDEHGATLLDIDAVFHSLDGTSESSTGLRIDRSNLGSDFHGFCGGHKVVLTFRRTPGGLTARLLVSKS